MRNPFPLAAGQPADEFPALRGLCLSAFCMVLTLLLASAYPSSLARADSVQSEAAHLSDAAFALLNSVESNATLAGPLLAPVASLASDTQSLATALGNSNKAAAAHAMAAVIADRGAIDAAAAKGSRSLDLAQWAAIKSEIASLESAIHPVAGPVGPAMPPAAASASPAASELPPAAPAAPRVMIISRIFTNGAVRVKGFLEGNDLKSAGIYVGSQPLRKIDVAGTPGSQRVSFDFGLEDPSPSEIIQVTDSLGRTAEARVAPHASVVARSSDGHEKMIELGGGTTDDSVASAGPLTDAVPPPGNNTAEIPRAEEGGDPLRRLPGGAGGVLTGVQINIIGVMPVMSQPGSLEVIGQISGAGVHRAGIYVDGRLIKAIPISAGAYSAFDVTFPMMGKAATIRAYGVGSNFVEASVDTSDNGMTVYNNPPAYPSPYYPTNPYGYGVNPYARPPAYPPGYGPPPYGTPGYAYPPNYGYRPPPSTPWWRRLVP
jgi:hypothetical protein